MGTTEEASPTTTESERRAWIGSHMITVIERAQDEKTCQFMGTETPGGMREWVRANALLQEATEVIIESWMNGGVPL